MYDPQRKRARGRFLPLSSALSNGSRAMATNPVWYPASRGTHSKLDHGNVSQQSMTPTSIVFNHPSDILRFSLLLHYSPPINSRSSILVLSDLTSTTCLSLRRTPHQHGDQPPIDTHSSAAAWTTHQPLHSLTDRLTSQPLETGARLMGTPQSPSYRDRSC